MTIKYISFLIGIIWSYSIIKTQSVFSKKAGIIFKIFITNISWLTLIAACYFGYKNFSIKLTIFGVILGILLVNIGFYFSKKFINEKFDKRKVELSKIFFEYTLILWVIYYVLF
jgi:predicted membrane protein